MSIDNDNQIVEVENKIKNEEETQEFKVEETNKERDDIEINKIQTDSLNLQEEYQFKQQQEQQQQKINEDIEACLNILGDEINDTDALKKRLIESYFAYRQLKNENTHLSGELQDIRREMDELQDQFRLDDADEFRQLQAELEIAAKNCRILQFKLRKLEKRNDQMEAEKMMMQDKFDEYTIELEKMRDLEEELLVAKEVSIRLHSELEQAEEWRQNTEKLNSELKNKLDELKEHIDIEIKDKPHFEDYHYLIIVQKLYETMFREYALQEQIALNSPHSQTQNDTRQLREVTDMLNTYQQKISHNTEEIASLRQELHAKDKELDQMKVQLKNLKRSRSSDFESRPSRSNSSPSSVSCSNSSGSTMNLTTVGENGEESSSKEQKARRRSASADNTEALIRRIDLANDEIKLLKNKILRLEDDLSFVQHERDCLSSQLKNTEDKLKRIKEEENENEEKPKESYDNEVDLVDLDKIVAKQQLEQQQQQQNKLQPDIELLINELNNKLNEKEKQMLDLQENENRLKNEIDSLNSRNNLLKMQIDNQEKLISELKMDIELKNNLTKELELDVQKLNIQINELYSQLNEKLNEIETLTKENSSLKERTNDGDKSIQKAHFEIESLKRKIDQLNGELDLKTKEINNIEMLIKSKENELGDFNLRLTVKEMAVKDKLEECERQRLNLIHYQEKYANLSAELDNKVVSLNMEIERLKKDKEKLNQDLIELRAKYHDSPDGLAKFEINTLKAKYEAKVQYLELEGSQMKNKMNKLLKSKEVQEQVLKENQQIAREITQKYQIDSENWNKQRQTLIEKEKLYEESIQMRKELKAATDRLRQKLQLVEEQAIDKENRHLIEKSNWETQRLQLVTTINRLEEQLFKLKSGQKKKKEIESAWDKERLELHHAIQTLQIVAKDLQAQLAQKNSLTNHTIEYESMNEQVKSVNSENEFLKNRIKDLEGMVNELEQIKRFMFDLKDAYETEKNDWMSVREDLRSQLEAKDILLNECYTKLNILLLDVNKFKSKNEAPRAIQEKGDDEGFNREETQDNLQSYETNMMTMSMIANEFEPTFDKISGKIDRVKDSMRTHRKFMDIVKSKSNKVLNRKSTSSSVNEMYQINMPNNNSRGSVPPEARNQISIPPPRAKSVCKESTPIYTRPSQQAFFSPSRFFSLNRIKNKIRFNSQSDINSIKTQMDDSYYGELPQSQPQPIKKSFRERALSPSKILRTIRNRSPFGRKSAHSVLKDTPPPPPIKSTLNVINSNNRMTMSCYSTIENPLENDALKNQPQQLQQKSHTERSISCEFIDDLNTDLKVKEVKKVSLLSFSESIENDVPTSAEIVKSVKFKDIPEATQDVQSSSVSLSIDNETNFRSASPNLKPAMSANNVDRPPKPPLSGARQKFLPTKSRTIDFPDLLQGTLDEASNTQSKQKPIQSILRRSETPPNTKQRQVSIESNPSIRDFERESSIEKRLRITSSTSRPLMFNN